MIGYEPLGVPKEVAPEMWIVDGPAVRFRKLDMPTRMTVMRLGGGDLMLHAPVGYTQWLGRDLEVLGRVRHLIAPNGMHFSGLPEWQKRFPEAISWGAPGVAARAAKRGVKLRIDRELGPEAPPDWAGDVDQTIFAGSRSNDEAVFFHRAARTLVLCDLIQNLEPGSVPVLSRPRLRMAGVLDPDGKTPRRIRMSFRGGRKRLRPQVQWMLDRAPERVVLSHGRWYAENGTEELRRAFRWAL